MEKWQVEHITKNLTELITLTTFNCIVKARLVENYILNQVTDVDWLNAQEKQDGPSVACGLYYQSLMGRTGAYKVLWNVLMECNQSGAARVLARVPPEIFSKPLTYLGISLELTSFQHVYMEVNGNVVKVNEFFPNVDFKSLHKIFHETVPELVIYDTFITKERTFVLAKNTIPPHPSLYVPRFLSNRVKLDKTVFKVDCQDVFVFKNSIARYELSEIAKPHFTDTSTSQLNNITSRFIYLDENEDWAKLKNNCARVPIHLINYEINDDTFILEDSSAPSNILKKLGSKLKRVYMSEVDFIQQQLSHDCKSSSVCICDTPGMGKTFLLTNIARLMTDSCAARIIVFISLTTFAKDFCPVSSDTVSEPKTSLINVLRYICTHQQNPGLLLGLIQAKFIQMELFFDGFDELPTDKVEWTKEVFGSITSNYPTVRIYITSRPHMRQELENTLGVVAYDILPFNNQNQVDFLVQYWQTGELGFDRILLQNYATSCLKTVNKTLTQNDREIAGIPLLCQLIAEVYGDKVAFYSMKIGKFCSAPLKISGMYQKFIYNKINPVSKNKEEFENVKLIHIWFALKLLFPKRDFHEDKQFKNVKASLKYFEILRAGILQKHSNGSLEFIHRTFAEFLVADYFITELQDKEIQKTEDLNSKSVSIFDMLMKPRWNYDFVHQVVVYFVNSALGEVYLSEKLKKLTASYITSIQHHEIYLMLCACCEHNLFHLFSFVKEVLLICDCSRILECHTNANSYEILKVCIKKSNCQMFHSCIHLLTEVLKSDLAKINTFDKHNTLLQMAINCANYEAVEYLVDRISLKNQNILDHCVRQRYEIKKREDILHLLLNKDPTLIHETPAILLTTELDRRLFKILAKFEANQSAVNEYGNCAMYAAKYMSPSDYHELVQFLLTDCKAEFLFLENEKWKDPLPTIIEHATLFPETLSLLLKIPGIEINMKDRYGESLLFSAVQGSKASNFQQLVDRGLDYNEKGKGNTSLLHLAARHGGLEMVRYLLSLKLEPNSRDENDDTPLHYAAKSLYGRLTVVESLVKNGANVRAKNNTGQTALHFYAKYGDSKTIEVIKYLITQGAEVNDRDKNRNSPLHICWKKDVRDCMVDMGAGIHAKKLN